MKLSRVREKPQARPGPAQLMGRAKGDEDCQGLAWEACLTVQVVVSRGDDPNGSLCPLCMGLKMYSSVEWAQKLSREGHSRGKSHSLESKNI